MMGGVDDSLDPHLEGYILCTHSALAATAAREGGGTFLPVQLQEPLLSFAKVVRIDLTELRMEASIVNGADLIQADILILLSKLNLHVPRALMLLGCRWRDQIEAVSKLLENKHRT